MSLETEGIIDPSEVFLDENNNPVAPGEFGGNPANPAGIPPTNDPPKGDPPAPADKPGDKPADKPGESPAPGADPAQPGELDRSTFANPAAYAMKWLGYETDEIDFGDGVAVKLDELTPEQQTDVLMNQLETVVDAYESALQEANSGSPQLQDDFQRQVFDFMKSGGSPKELAQYILDNDPSGTQTLSDEQIVRKHLTETMGLEGDELEDEVKFLKDGNRLDAYTARAKKYFQGKGTDLSGLSASQQERIAKAEQDSVQAWEDERAKVTEHSTQTKDIGGIPLNQEAKDFITSQITPKSHSEDSEFISKLNSPSQLFRLAFLDNYFEDIMDNVKSTYFEMGKNSMKPPGEGLSKDPIKVRSFRTPGQSGRPAAVTADGKVDLDKVVNSSLQI